MCFLKGCGRTWCTGHYLSEPPRGYCIVDVKSMHTNVLTAAFSKGDHKVYFASPFFVCVSYIAYYFDRNKSFEFA